MPGQSRKLVAEGKSLLPIGMTAVEGEVSRGEVIAVRDAGRGDCAWSGQLRQLRRRACCAANRSASSKLLGYTAEPEMVHRDNLVLDALRRTARGCPCFMAPCGRYWLDPIGVELEAGAGELHAVAIGCRNVMQVIALASGDGPGARKRPRWSLRGRKRASSVKAIS